MGVHAADVDDDGDDDLLVMNLDSESDSFFRNDGTLLRRRDTAPSACAWSSRRFTRFGMGFSTSTTTAGSTSTRPTAASACRARRSPPIPYAEPNLLLRGHRRAGVRGGAAARRHGRAARRAPAAPPPSATSTATAGSTSWSPTATRAPHLLRNVAPRAGTGARCAVRRRAAAATRSARRADARAPAAASCAATCARPTATWPRTTRASTSASARPRRVECGGRPLDRRRRGALRPVRRRPHRHPPPRHRRHAWHRRSVFDRSRVSALSRQPLFGRQGTSVIVVT